jgi:hypothetical protein
MGIQTLFIQPHSTVTPQRSTATGNHFSKQRVVDTYLEVSLLDSWAVEVLVSQVIQSSLQSLGVLQQVDDHVETVQDTQGVGTEIAARWVLNVDCLEESLGIRVELNHPAQEEKSIALRL